MSTSRRQVRALTNLNAKQTFQKHDGNDLIFEVSGGLANGYVKSNVAITGTAFSGSGDSKLGSLYIQNSLEVNGDFTVRGTPTIINSDVLEIKDNIVVINKISGSADAYNTAEGGLYINRGSAQSASFLWISSSADFNFQSSSDGSFGLADIAARKVKATLLSASTEVAVNSNFVMAGTASLHTSASFTNITLTPSSKTVEGVTYNIVNLDDALHAIDNKLGVVSSTTAIANAYKCLRYQFSGTLDGTGYAEVSLPATQLSKNAFPVADLDYITTDVMVDLSGRWVNDLVAIDLQNDAGTLKVTIDAPASPNTGFRLIAVNENTSSYSI